jgi:hypothetical protein
MRFHHVFLALITLSAVACEEQPVAPIDEIGLATSLTAEGTAAMGGDAAGPASILRNLVQQVRDGTNAEAKALLAQADELIRRARAEGNRELAREAHGLVIQAVALQFPNAATRIASAARAGLERVRAALGDRDAPRIRRVLDEIGATLRRSAAADAEGRKAVALELALRASQMLTRLVEHVRSAQ